ncbi:MAG: NAD-dependent epimerase/dehydratase family protein [Bryobacteraceae bacterium]
MIQNQRAAVIGATGFIGSHLTERLVAEGNEVLAIAQSRRHLDALAGVEGQCEFRTCDVTDPDSLAEILEAFRPRYVFHLAAHPDGPESIQQIETCVRVNALGVINALNAANQAGCEVFAFADSAKVYGNSGVPHKTEHLPNPICSYAVAKTAAWQLCKLVAALSGMQVVGLRLTFVYGPRQNWNLIRYVQQCATAGQQVKVQGGSQTRDPLYIDDAIDAFLLAATQRVAYGHSIPIGGGQEMKVLELCRAVLRAMGEELPVVANAEQPRLTEIWRSACDNTDAKLLLNWSPRTTLMEGLTRTIRWQPGQTSAARGLVAAARSQS